MQTFYDHLPTTLEKVGNGSYRFRWDIEEYDSQWRCQEVIVWPPLTANRITAAVISDQWPSDYEQKLINEYNAFLLGIASEDKSEQYKAFLQKRQEVKEMIDQWWKGRKG